MGGRGKRMTLGVLAVLLLAVAWAGLRHAGEVRVPAAAPAPRLEEPRQGEPARKAAPRVRGAQAAALPHGPCNERPSFLLCAMTTGIGQRDVAGILERRTGRGALVKVGDRTADGWLLVSMDFEQETARFEKGGVTHTLSMAESQKALRAAPSAAGEPGLVAETAAPTPEPPRLDGPEAAFSNRVYQLEDGGEMAVKGIEGTAGFVEVCVGGGRYALARDVAESALRLSELTPEQRLALLLAFPGVVQVGPGEDPGERAAEAARLLAERLTPPAEAPPVEDLHRMMDEAAPDAED